MRIGTKLVASLIIAVAVITGLYAVFQMAKGRKALREQRMGEVRVIARTLEVAVENAIRRDQWEDVQSLFEEVKGFSGVERVTLYKADGSVLVTSDPSAEKQIPLTPMFQDALRRKKPVSFFPEEGGRRGFHYLIPMRLAWRGTSAVLEVVSSASRVEGDIRRLRNEIVIAELFIVAVIAVAVWYLTRRNISRPIEALIQGVVAIGSGDLARRIPVQRRDELGRLAIEFNRMAENLERARDQILEETVRKLELERQLQHSEKLAAVGRLAAGLAHEVGTPLNVVSGRAEYLLSEFAEDAPEAKSLRVILDQIERIRETIEQLLGYARIHRPEVAPTFLPDVFKDVLALLDHEIRKRGIDVELHLPSELSPIAADPNLLQQVFLNLVLNAVDAMPDGGTLQVNAAPSRGGKEVEVQVIDTGCGIPPEHLPRIFDPFFTTKEPGRGTGLGLSVVYGIVRDHGGSIAVKSQVGAGTTFTVHLPVYQSDVRSPGAKVQTSQPSLDS